MKKEDYKRQLIIANTLYEMGIDDLIIQKITTIEKKDLEEYRLNIKKNRNIVDKKKDKSI